MSEPSRPAAVSLRAWALAASVVVPVLALARLGQDRNWDLLNYHLYNPHAWWRGRAAIDLAPAQLQTWHSPWLDLPLYLMNQAGWHGAAIGLWLTLPLMLALWLLMRLHIRLSGAAASRLGLVVLAWLAVTGASAYGTLGTSFNEAFVAAGLLLALAPLLSAPDPGHWRPWLLAGVIAGATAGLKLTAGIFCLGLAAAALAAPQWRRSPARLAALLAGGVLGAALTYGAWAQSLQVRFGNPVFPYFNQVFASPAALPDSHADGRFRAGTVTDVVAVPLRLLGNSRRYSESTLRDPRLLGGLLALLALAWSARQRRDDDALARLRMLAAFALVSGVAWALAYGIYRYLLPVELLCSLLVVLAVERFAGRRRLLWLLGVGLLALAATNHPSWQRRAFSQPMVEARWPALPAQSLVLISSAEPLAYAIIGLPDDVPVISVINNFSAPEYCTGLQREALRRIAAHAGPLWLLRGDSPRDDLGAARAEAAYGLRVDGACRSVVTSEGDLRLCPLRRTIASLPCPAAPAGAQP